MAAKQLKMESHTTITILGAHASDNIRRRIIDSYCSILNFRLLFWTDIKYHNWKFTYDI